MSIKRETNTSVYEVITMVLIFLFFVFIFVKFVYF
jgi:hypothetical protein